MTGHSTERGTSTRASAARWWLGTDMARRVFYCAVYLAAIIAANTLTATFGPAMSKYTAFAFIGLDFVVMDGLHEAWRGRGLLWRMGILIAAGSALSWFLNANAGRIGLASFIAFCLATVIDRLVYWAGERMGMVRWKRGAASNLCSSLVDSIAFPALAFGWPPDPDIVFAQFTAKLAGAQLWMILGMEKAQCPSS